MKKKIKDLTIAEIIDTCDKTAGHDCLTGTCPLNILCGAMRNDISNVSYNIIHICDKEVTI